MAKLKPTTSPPSRIWLHLTPGGQLDLTRLPQAARERLRAWYADQKFLEALGLVPQDQAEPAGEGPQFPFTEREAAALWKVVGEAQAWLAARAFKLPPDAAAVLRFSDAERALLAGPTVAVLTRYAPGWLAEHKDEAALALLVLAVEQAKFSRALAIKRQAEVRPEAAPAGREFQEKEKVA